MECGELQPTVPQILDLIEWVMLWEACLIVFPLQLQNIEGASVAQSLLHIYKWKASVPQLQTAFDSWLSNLQGMSRLKDTVQMYYPSPHSFTLFKSGELMVASGYLPPVKVNRDPDVPVLEQKVSLQVH